MDKNSIIQKLRSIKPELELRFVVSKLALFGSYSRNEQTSKSDIDEMVDFSK
jgi:predicted nucleotidyltransferase